MTKAEFKTLFVAALQANGPRELDPKQIESALAKTVRHMKAKYGRIDWSEEYLENEVGNAVCFFSEYKAVKTFNRERARINR